jgi:hypothetical protein
MGYLLPLSSFEREQFHHRMINEQKELYRLTATYKSMFQPIDSRFQRKDVPFSKKEKKPSFFRNQSGASHSTNEQLIADITGKGRLFNERI